MGGRKEEALAPTELADLARIMDLRYAPYLKERFFVITTDSERALSLATILLRNRDESFWYPVEGRMEFRQQNLSHRDSCLFLIDYIDMYFSEFLQEDERSFIPIDWSPFQFEGVAFQLKGQILNRKAASMADMLLEGANATGGPG